MSHLTELKERKLTAQRVFDYFEEICAIPHGSRNTKQIQRLSCGLCKSARSCLLSG